MTAPCTQVERLDDIDARLTTIETTQAIATERWATVTTEIRGLGERLDAHAKGSEERSAELTRTLLGEITGARKAREASIARVLGLVGTIVAALASAGGIGWWTGATGATATARVEQAQADGVVEAAP